MAISDFFFFLVVSLNILEIFTYLLIKGAKAGRKRASIHWFIAQMAAKARGRKANWVSHRDGTNPITEVAAAASQGVPAKAGVMSRAATGTQALSKVCRDASWCNPPGQMPAALQGGGATGAW